MTSKWDGFDHCKTVIFRFQLRKSLNHIQWSSSPVLDGQYKECRCSHNRCLMSTSNISTFFVFVFTCMFVCGIWLLYKFDLIQFIKCTNDAMMFCNRKATTAALPPPPPPYDTIKSHLPHTMSHYIFMHCHNIFCFFPVPVDWNQIIGSVFVVIILIKPLGNDTKITNPI